MRFHDAFSLPRFYAKLVSAILGGCENHRENQIKIGNPDSPAMIRSGKPAVMHGAADWILDADSELGAFRLVAESDTHRGAANSASHHDA
jgi:hypothetical protein